MKPLFPACSARALAFGLSLGVTALAVLGSGCAGKLGNLSQPDSGLPTDVPKELADRFEVREVVTPEPLPSPQPTASAAPAPAKKPSPVATRPPKGKKSAPEAFVYPMRIPAKPAVWVGEKHELDMMFMGLVVGDVSMEALPLKEIQGRRVHHIRAHAKSSSVFSLFYKIDDFVDTFWDYEGLFSHRFQLALNESKQRRNSLELNDSEKRSSYYRNQIDKLDGNGPQERAETFPMEPFSQDTLSSLYWMRSLPLENGKTYSYTVISEGKTLDVSVTSTHGETLTTSIGKIAAIKLRAVVKQRPNGEHRGEGFFWFSDDSRRIVLRFEAKVRVGSVAAVIKRFTPGESPQSMADESP